MNSIERFMAKQAFKGQKKVRLIRQLQRLIHAGVPLSRSLDMLRKLYSKQGKKPKEPIALMIGDWQGRLKAGKSLSQSMHGWVSTSEEMIIEAGEQSEKLASSLEDALEATGAASKIRKAIIGGLIYPFILLLVLCFMLYGFSTDIVPTFETIVPAEEWTGNAAVMNKLSQFIVNWMALIGMIVGVVTTAIFLSFPILRGPARKHLDRIPPWSIYKITQGASFMITMRGFLSAGIPIPEALRKMLKAGNPYFRERVAAILARINMGRNLGEAMYEAGHNFPDDEISGEVSIYAGLDNFSESLDLLAKEWVNGAVEKATIASKIINNVMLVLLAGSIGYIAMSIFELQDIITKGAEIR